MKSSIIYVFKVIISLTVSGVLWFLIIGTLGDKTAGTFGSDTVFKSGVWETAQTAYTDTYLRVSDNNGKGFAERTKSIWDSALNEQKIN